MLQACMRFDTALQMQRDNGSYIGAVYTERPNFTGVSYGKRAITVAAKDRIEHVKGKYVGREADKKRVSPWTNARTFRKSKTNARFSASPPPDFRSNSYPVDTNVSRTWNWK